MRPGGGRLSARGIARPELNRQISGARPRRFGNNRRTHPDGWGLGDAVTGLRRENPCIALFVLGTLGLRESGRNWAPEEESWTPGSADEPGQEGKTVSEIANPGRDRPLPLQVEAALYQSGIVTSVASKFKRILRNKGRLPVGRHQLCSSAEMLDSA